MKKGLAYILITLLSGLVLYSCVKKNNYPKTPEIEYKDFFPYTGDSADIQIKFTDGDGDIGVGDGDTTQTLFITYYYLDTVSSKYVAYYSPFLNDTLRTGYIVKAPNDSYQGKPISGEVNARLQQYRHSKKIKHVKYVIYMYDKSGNKSNIVSTPEITVP
jgi:hypothetical protein